MVGKMDLRWRLDIGKSEVDFSFLSNWPISELALHSGTDFPTLVIFSPFYIFLSLILLIFTTAPFLA